MRMQGRGRFRFTILGWVLPLLVLTHAGASAEPTASPPPVHALEALTVRPDPAESRLPDPSTAATLFHADTIAATAAPHLQQLLGLTPNLTWAGGTSRPRYFQIRGIGERSQFAGEGPPNFSVGMLVDDMDLSGIGMHASLFDVQEVEVLRGPQAAVFGSKALAGLIHIRTADPTPAPAGHAQLEIGTEDTHRLAAAVGGPLGTTAGTPGVRVSVERAYQNGFRRNVARDRDDTNARDEWTARAKLRWEPDPDWHWTLATLWSRYDNGYDEFTPDNNGFTTYADRPGRDLQDTTGGSLRGVWKGPAAWRLLSISSVVATDLEYSYDADWGNDAFWAAAPYFFDPAAEGYHYDFTERLRRQRRNVTQDFRVISEPGGEIFGGSTAWHLGLYGSALDEEDRYTGFDALRSDYEAYSGAIYGQLATRLSPTLVWRNAGRVEERRTEYRDDQGVTFTGSDTMWGGRVALEHQTRDDLMLFGAVARGFKGSGVNPNPALDPDRRRYAPETVWNYETGARARGLDGRGEAALTLFYMRRDSLQIGSSYQADPTDPSSFVYFTDNAASGYNLGAELEATLQVGGYWEVFGHLTLLDTEYRNYTAADGAERLEGREQPYAPRTGYLLGAQWRPRNGLFARAEVQGKDDFYLSDSHDARADGYTLLNLSAGYGRGPWTLTLWGRNVTDRKYVTRGYVFGLEPPDFVDTLYVTYGDPAHFGATLDLVF